jgi:hypothetical protein
MKNAFIIFATAFATLTARICVSQSFINLNCESTTLAPDGAPGTVSTNAGVPGWTALIGGVPQSTILYNNGTLGASCVALLAGGTYSPNPVIDGNFSVMLVGGSGGDASLSQSGLIPSTANSILFDAYSTTAGGGGGTNFLVSIGGQTIEMLPLINNGSYIVYGGNISSLAGQEASLQISSLSFFPQGGGFNVFVFDDVQFSSSQVPEPTTLGLLGLGSFLLSWHRRRISAQCSTPPNQL